MSKNDLSDKEWGITLIIALTLWIVGGAVSCSEVISDNKTVYICAGEMSSRYHKYVSCDGLYNCSDKIYDIKKKTAEEYGYTPCRYCYE